MTTGEVTFETRQDLPANPYCYIWGLQGKVKETSPELIALDDDDYTMNETTVQYELLPANYPVFNSYLDIYENDSRLYLSGAATDNETTIHQRTCFDWDKNYKAQLVVNKYYVEDIEIPFDIWDDDPEVREQKELYFIKMNWVDLEGNKAEYATLLDPEELEPYDHEPEEPGGPGGFGGPPEDSTFSYLVDPFRFENVTIDMEVSPQKMNLDLVSNVSDYAESFTLYRYGIGAFVDENETLSITMTDKPERDDTKLEELTSFTINPIFGEMKTLELYETGTDTNIFCSRKLEIVITLDQYPTDGIADTLEMTLTNNLAPGIIVTETLTETDLDSKIFTGPDNTSLTFDHFSDRDSVAQDDIRAIVTCPALNLENAFIDARETDTTSLEFRTDVLHNQGEAGSGYFKIDKSCRKAKCYIDDKYFKKREKLDVTLVLKQGNQEKDRLPGFLVVNESDGNDPFGNYRFVKGMATFQGGHSFPMNVNFVVKDCKGAEPSLDWNEGNDINAMVIVSGKIGDSIQIIDSNKETILATLNIFDIIIMDADFIDFSSDFDNNFDIRDSNGELLAELNEDDRRPEWRRDGEQGVETCYIKDSKVRVTVKFQSDPDFLKQHFNNSIGLDLYSEGDLDFTSQGNENRQCRLDFDPVTGIATQTFTTNEKKVSDELDFKDYEIHWKLENDDFRSETKIVIPIYSLYGKPTENWNVPPGINTSEPMLDHLKYLLGPKIGNKGAWCNGTKNLNEKDDTLSIPYMVALGLIKDGIPGTSWDAPPWIVLEKSGMCENFAHLMENALLVAGLPENKVDRKSVVVCVREERPSTWFGGAPKKLVKIFRTSDGGKNWLNEGVCGVNTDDKGWRFYDIFRSELGNIITGTGSWKNPDILIENDSQNLWYEPKPPTFEPHGPVIFDVIPERYGSWAQQEIEPWEPEARKIEFPTLIKFKDFKMTGGNSCSITFMTEGVKDYGVRVRVILQKKEGLYNWNPISFKIRSIIHKWYENSDDDQVVTFEVLGEGTYRIIGRIETEDAYYYPEWQVISDSFSK